MISLFFFLSNNDKGFSSNSNNLSINCIDNFIGQTTRNLLIQVKTYSVVFKHSRRNVAQLRSRSVYKALHLTGRARLRNFFLLRTRIKKKNEDLRVVFLEMVKERWRNLNSASDERRI